MRIGIKEKLLGGFAVVLLLFVGTTIYSLQSIYRLQKHVQMTHNHPLTVTRAVIKIEVGVTAIHRSMKDITLSFTDEAQNKYISIVQKNEKDTITQFDIVLKQILGEEGKKLALHARKVFVDWKPIRARVIALVKDGKQREAQLITRAEGDKYIEIIMGELKKLEEYAASKAMSFYKDSADIAIRTRYTTIMALTLSTAIGLSIAFFISVSITRRLKSISRAAMKMSEGELDTTIIDKGDDEIHQLADSFNKMALQLNKMYESLALKIRDRTETLESANKELFSLKQNLEAIVFDRTKELEKKILKLDRSEKAMLYMVEDLNQTSRQLKTERENLSTVNKELESFSYSVSHDLRAPLRGIDGFSQALLEDYEDKLDDEGKDFLREIRMSAIEMAGLIDALLLLSRITRKEFLAERVDLSDIARKAFKILEKSYPERSVHILIEEGLIVNGDKSLLGTTLGNLLENAWKFTSKSLNATIKIGVTLKNNEKIYFVEDNGAGFNMEYSNKLFGVFQRLHNKSDFEGTGIGLANVQRIVERHGGRIWAEAEEGKGATFYFTLKEEA